MYGRERYWYDCMLCGTYFLLEKRGKTIFLLLFFVLFCLVLFFRLLYFYCSLIAKKVYEEYGTFLYIIVYYNIYTLRSIFRSRLSSRPSFIEVNDFLLWNFDCFFFITIRCFFFKIIFRFYFNVIDKIKLPTKKFCFLDNLQRYTYTNKHTNTFQK